MLVTHLDKSGSGMSFKSACGRNVIRCQLSTNWEDFKTIKPEHRCAKCDASKQADLNRRTDAKNVESEVVQKDDWYTRDLARIAELKAKRK